MGQFPGNFLASLMEISLPFLKDVPKKLCKNVLMRLNVINEIGVSNRYSYSKKHLLIRNNYTDYIKLRNGK